VSSSLTSHPLYIMRGGELHDIYKSCIRLVAYTCSCSYFVNTWSAVKATYYPVGKLPKSLSPGDFLLSRREHAFMGKCIRFFQRFKLAPEYAKWSHAFLSLGGDTIQEALEWGQERNSIETYRDAELLHVQLDDVPWHDIKQMMEFADSCYYHKRTYGYMTIASLAISLVTDNKLMFSKAGTAICSGFVAEALVRAGYIFDKPPDYVTPGDLAVFAALRGKHG
jgi:hypothetical protein